jgi:neutral amino acid transport system permease protein
MALSSSIVSLGIFVGIYALLAIGLNIKFGYGGLLDIGHVTFFLIGAYTAALVVLPPAGGTSATYIMGWDMSWFVGILAAMVVASVAGMLIALPAIRLREDYLAITVLGFSVIAKRIVQSEGWLANGPRALRGWDAPFRSSFPLPDAAPVVIEVMGSTLFSIPTELVYGFVVFVLWATGAYLVAASDEQDWGIGKRAVVALSTLGVGYAAGRLGRQNDSPILYGLGAGIVVGAVATAAAFVVPPGLAILAFLGTFSLFTWAFAIIVVTSYYGHATRRDVATAAGLAVAFVGVFAPLILLGGSAATELESTAGLVITLVLLVSFIAGVVRLGDRWETRGLPFVSIVGFGAVWLFALRYFAFALIVPFKQGGPANALGQLLQNIAWLVKFAASGPTFGYQRFILILVFAIVAATYVLAEVTVQSPFGRVLKAIREDEDVASALGKNVFAFKIQSMMLGSALAGLAGALWALSIGALVHTMFAPRVTFIVFLMVIIGGTANNRGVMLGSVIYWGFQKATEDLAAFFPTAARSSVQALRLSVIGALLIVILYYRSEGIWGEETMTTTEVNNE